jgi:uroporphyrinogen III methyltransferase/synthase
MANKGMVYITGAGPGDFGLLTLKALECIKKADVLVYDRLISDQILHFAKKGAELIYVGKKADYHAMPQEEISRLLVQKALEGKIVTRVKGGDPFLFGRGGEEAECLAEHGVDFEIIPGVTAAISVPAYAGIPVTHRDCCSSLHIITGHERPDKTGSAIDYSNLAKLEGTLVFMMGVENLANICNHLIQHGKSESTPVAVIANGTTSQQQVVSGRLDNIAQLVSKAGVKPPAVTVIGQVVNLRERLNWFPHGRLAGKRIVVTRAREQASELTKRIEVLGGGVIEFPTIRIAEPADFRQFDEIIHRISAYHWLVFTSVNGVQAFFHRMKTNQVDIRSLQGKICAVGASTQAALNDLGLNVDYVPEQFTTDELLNGLLKRIQPGEKALLARADIANPELSNGLRGKGIPVDDLTVYRTLLEPPAGLAPEELLEKSIDFITFTSSSTVRNFVKLIGPENCPKLSGARIVCIGPVTAETARELGLDVEAVADVYTIDGLVAKLVELAEKGSRS